MLPILRLSALALIGLLVANPANISAQDVPPAPPQVPELRVPGVQPGDRVTLTLYNQGGQKLTDIGGERTVDGRGLLYLPFLEEVSVLGLTQDEVRKKLDAGYESYYSGSVVEVEVKYKINITGAVRNAGTYYLSPNSTLTDALSEAGGSSSEVDVGLQGGAADASRVALTRRGYDAPIIINFRPIEASDEIVNGLIQSGDWIHVPTARRSRLRDDLNFVGSIISVLLGVATLILLASR